VADLTYDKIPDTCPRAGRDSYVAADAEQMYGGQLVGLDGGYLTKWADSATALFVGFLLEAVLGDASADPLPEGRVNDNGDIIVDVPIAGIDATKVGTPVFCPSSNIEDATLTPALGPAIGIVDRFRSTGRGDVKLLTPTEAYAKA
jgi:hypothetical protein